MSVFNTSTCARKQRCSNVPIWNRCLRAHAETPLASAAQSLQAGRLAEVSGAPQLGPVNRLKEPVRDFTAEEGRARHPAHVLLSEDVPVPQVLLFALLLAMLIIPLGVVWLALFEERRQQFRQGAVVEGYLLRADHLD